MVGLSAAQAEAGSQAPVEARVIQAPRPVAGADGLTHLAYELTLGNVYDATGTLRLRRVAVFVDGATAPLLNVADADVTSLLAQMPEEVAAGATLAAGKTTTLFLWLTLPAKAPVPRILRHVLEFETVSGERQVIDGVRVGVNATRTVVVGPPLRAGRWLAHEGPGNPHSHHWGSLVAANGRRTIPQRYAIDFFGLDPAFHAVRTDREKIDQSTVADWAGFDTEVLAVADGVVRDRRDGEPDNKPLAPLAAPDDLTARTLYGNFVVLEIAPHVFVHYAHLRTGSVTVAVGQHVSRGTVLGRLGQSGNANAPHLHFHLSDIPTFEESEGIPFVFETFERLGTVSVADVLDPAVPVALKGGPAQRRQREMPLDDDVVRFP